MLIKKKKNIFNDNNDDDENIRGKVIKRVGVGSRG